MTNTTPISSSAPSTTTQAPDISLYPFYDLLEEILTSDLYQKLEETDILDLFMKKLCMQRFMFDANEYKDTISHKYPTLEPDWHSAFIDVLLYILYSGELPLTNTVPHRYVTLTRKDLSNVIAAQGIAGESLANVLQPIAAWLKDAFFIEQEGGNIIKKLSVTIALPKREE